MTDTSPLTDAIDTVVGTVVAELVREEFSRHRPDDDGAPSVRLSGFREGEIASIVRGLLDPPLRTPGRDTVATVVVAGTPRPGVPPEVFLQPGWTMTRHRNENDHGLVLIDLDPQSDQNGVRQGHQVADGDILDIGDAIARQRIRWLVPSAWRVVARGDSMDPPPLLTDVVAEVFDALAGIRQYSLRTWAAYVTAVASRTASTGLTPSGPEARDTAAELLDHLNLFPDDRLFDKATPLHRRLAQNVDMADLRSPQGSDMADDELARRIDDVVLRDRDGEPLDDATTTAIRTTMRNVVDAGGPDQYTSVALRLWEQLFEKRRPSTGLGTQIQANLETHHPDRVEDYQSLRVQDGLDEGEPEAALTLVRSESPSGAPSILDSVDPRLRRRVERLAYQGEHEAPDPLIALLYGLHGVELTGDTPAHVKLVWDEPDPSRSSARLFAFLYRDALSAIEEACDGILTTRFTVSHELHEVPPIADLVTVPAHDDDDEDADDRSRKEWLPLRFRLVQTGQETPLLRFRWDPGRVPGHAAFAYLVARGLGADALIIPPLETWSSDALAMPWSSGPEIVRAVRDDLGVRLDELRADHFSTWARNGLSVAAIDEYLAEWEPLLQEATDRYVPHGGALPGLDSFVERDTATTSDGHFAILATHPLRLRWFRHHLDQLGRAIIQALQGELLLNPQNDRVYFEWIERVSPHRQPPLMSPGPQRLATSVREVDLHELYALTGGPDDRQADWLGGLDSSSVDELVAVARSFLAAFPHKKEGLSVLLMATSGGAHTARRFVDQLRYRDYAGLDLELHVVTPTEDHDAVAAALAVLDSDEGRGTRLLPPFRLLLHPWDGGIPACFDELAGRVDLALAPNLFGLRSLALEETRRRGPGLAGRFDPWLDATSHSRPTDANTVNVSQVLLPSSPDPLLENWSTLTVRRRRQAPVSREAPDSVDFVTLQVAFDRNETLFRALHEVANWVVTLDPFIGRDQIDALTEAPDVIVVRSEVGKNRANTLVVSSTSGRSWVQSQLARRLVDDFGIAAERAEAIAGRLYDIGRNVVPGLMLRALGLGRTIEEILGLILARYAVDHFDPEPPPEEGVEFWISLDEYAAWFGGLQRIRPDLLRVRVMDIGDGSVRLDALVVESKFRRHFTIGTADEQVHVGCRLFDAALGADGPGFTDLPFWRRELLRAIAELSRRPTPAWSMPAAVVHGDPKPDELVAALRAGEFEFTGATPLVVATGWGPDDVVRPRWGVTDAGHRLLHLDRTSALDLIDRIDQGLHPREADPSIPPDDAATTATPTAPGRTAPDGFPPPSIGEIAVPIDAPPPVPSTDAADGPGPAGTGTVAAEAGGVRSSERPGHLAVAVLERRYGQILAKLDQLGVDVTRPAAPAYQEGPGFCLYRVVPMAGVSTDRVTAKIGDIKLALELPAELNLRAYVDKGSVVLEVPKEDEDRYFVSADELWHRTPDRPDALSIAIGEDIKGDPVEVDFSSSDTPHLLIAGQTGSGKSIALETILTGLCRRRTPDELQLLLVDPKSTELLALESDPHVRGEIGWDASDALIMLQDAVDEMNRRFQEFRDRRVRLLPEYNAEVAADARIPWWLLVLDEYADLTSDPDDRRAIEALLKRVAQKGRAVGVHLIVATQKPSAEVISTVVRSNLPAQLALRVKSAIDSRIIIEESGAESLSGKGDAFLRTGRGLLRLQCAKVD